MSILWGLKRQFTYSEKGTGVATMGYLRSRTLIMLPVKGRDTDQTYTHQLRSSGAHPLWKRVVLELLAMRLKPGCLSLGVGPTE